MIEISVELSTERYAELAAKEEVILTMCLLMVKVKELPLMSTG